ncbi:thiamine pyrophosphate-dependent enzyme [Streptomyces sp. NPDC052077]|uniref:thiamine pyrophosphate-dependent enzyme n=1 Tax=Streptomyces sp. NPDC052077 TaxID=3154757 RepID=UPI003437C5E6
MQLAQPERPVVAVLGDGSLQYTVQALWTAAHLRLPVTYVMVNNGGYGILKDLAAARDPKRMPAMDLPGIDIPALARGYGVRAQRVTNLRVLARALRAPGAPEPRLIDIRAPARSA